MGEHKKIQDAIDSIIKSPSANEYAVSTIKSQKYILNCLLKFMKEIGYTAFNEQVGIEYIYSKTDKRVDGFWGSHNSKINYIMKPLQNLLRALDGDNVIFFVRSHIKPFECPECFSSEYSAFKKSVRNETMQMRQ